MTIWQRLRYLFQMTFKAVPIEVQHIPEDHYWREVAGKWRAIVVGTSCLGLGDSPDAALANLIRGNRLDLGFIIRGLPDDELQ